MAQGSVGEGTISHAFGPKSEEDLRWRILVSIVGPVVWLTFTLLYVGFWAQGYSLFQSIMVILVSLVILGGVMAVVWTAWGMRRHEWWGH